MTVEATTSEADEFLRGIFDRARPEFAEIAGRFVDDPETIVDGAAAIFETMLPDMAYREKRDHPMASAAFICTANLALFLALKERGVDEHAYGAAMLDSIANRAPEPPAEDSPDRPSARDRMAQFVASAEASQTDALPGEFVYEAVFDSRAPDQREFDWGMNVKSCAICSAFARHDAMELVPYMCATDDLVSDREQQGLRRTGTIAVGASHCDFRFKRGGDPLRLVEHYPDRIRRDR